MIERYRKEYKIIGVIFVVLVLIGVVMLFMKVNVGVIDGKTLILLTALALAVYQDGLIRKLVKRLKDKEENRQTDNDERQ